MSINLDDIILLNRLKTDKTNYSRAELKITKTKTNGLLCNICLFFAVANVVSNLVTMSFERIQINFI